MFRLLPLLIFLGLLSGCATDLPPGAQRFLLTKDINTVGTTIYQVYWEVADTARWEATAAAADTTYRKGNYWKLRSDRIWYEGVELADGRLRAEQPYPGWERGVDSINPSSSIVFSERYRRLTARLPAADITLGGDSLRIGIVSVTGKAFKWQNFEVQEPDYLVLLPPGETNIPISLNLSNVGPISSQTIFRVGRRQYALTYVANDRREIIIEPYSGGAARLTAELDPIYRAAPALTVTGEKTRIKRKEGNELVLFFTAAYPSSKETIQKLDSTYRALPPQRRDKKDVAIILQHLPPWEQEAFFADLDVQVPLYVATERTCEQLVCRASMPYFAHVNGQGRVTTFWGYPDQLAEMWATEGAESTK